MSNKIKVVLGVLAIAVAVGVIVVLVVNSQNKSTNNVVSNNTTNTVENKVENSVNNTAVNNTVVDDKTKDGERDYSKKTMAEWKEAVKNGKIIIETFDSEGNKLDEFEVDKRTWLAIGFEGNTIDFIAGKFVEIELHPKMGFKDDEEVAIAVYKTEEEKKKIIETYFENAAEFDKYTVYNYGVGQNLLIVPRYDTVLVSLTDTTDKNYNPVVEDIRGKSILVNLDLAGNNKTFSLVFSHLIHNTEVSLQANSTTGELKMTTENTRVKTLTIEDAKKDTKNETKKD